MCGIFAFFLNRPLTPDDVALGRAGTAALRHRGPGAAGEWRDEEAGVFLGHTRLATFDPNPASGQPMERDGRCLVFNGELFNFRDLRGELKTRGVKFATQGDTEVLLRAWQCWGSEALDRFDGAFAFALWDGQEAVLAVDLFGEKFLFVAETPDGVYISSEIGPLARLLGLKPELSGDARVAYLSLGYLPAPLTAYPAIRRIPAATRMRLRGGRVVENQRYWQVPLGEPSAGRPVPLSERDLDHLQEAIARALEPRLRCDVPMCLFLSGGVDSVLLAAMAKRDIGVSLDCITASFKGDGVVDEAVAAKAIADHLCLSHRIVEGRLGESGATLDLLLSLFGQPVAATGAFALLEVSQAAARDYQVALTGSGADEIFMGFGKNVDFYRHRALYGLPEPLRRTLGFLAGAFAKDQGPLRRLASEIGVRDAERYIANRNFPAIDWLRKLDGFEVWTQSLFGQDDRPLELAVPAFEVRCVMPNSRFVAIDVSSMRASIAARSGFTHRGIAEAVARFDPRAFLAFGQKSVLRRILSRYLPADLIDPVKRGFTFPAAHLNRSLPAEPPDIPGLPAPDVAALWRRRDDGAGWSTLALRLAVAERFLHGAT